MLDKLRAFVSEEAVLVVAVAAAALSCALIPFDGAYASYIDWRTLALLFSLMAVVTGLRFLGVMRLAGQWVVSHASSARALGLLLVVLAFFSSMAVTNDVALITFVPLALVVLSEARLERFAAPVVVLMTVAANLGSMLLPVGNPQNLYLYQASGMSFSQFALLMAPASLLSLVLLAASALWVLRGGTGKSERRAFHMPGKPSTSSICLLVGYLVLFALCILAVAGLVDAFILAPVVAVLMLAFDRRALLLSGFTENWPALIVGTNIGGLGTPIASMASLISFKIATASGMVGKARYLAVFAAWNAAFLVALCVANAVFGWA